MHHPFVERRAEHKEEDKCTKVRKSVVIIMPRVCMPCKIVLEISCLLIAFLVVKKKGIQETALRIKKQYSCRNQ